jgi:hypothetical protein
VRCRCRFPQSSGPRSIRSLPRAVAARAVPGSRLGEFYGCSSEKFWQVRLLFQTRRWRCREMAKIKSSPAVPRPRRLPAGRVLEENVRGLMNYPNVVAAFIGKKQRKRKDTGQLSIVCGVREKVPEKDLEPRHVIPKNLELAVTPARSSRVSTDVIPIHGSFSVQSTVLGPSDIAFPGGVNKSTIGIAVRHPTFGKVITTAGHAIPQGFGTGGKMVVASGGSSFIAELAAEPRINQSTDHALLRPENQDLVGNFFRDVTPLGPPYIPDPDHDVGKQLFVLPAERDIVPVVCRGLRGSVRVGANLVMNDLILTDLRTEDGDSGACLVDGNWRAWGLLLGIFETGDDQGNIGSFSVFIPAFRVIFLESAQYL